MASSPDTSPKLLQHADNRSHGCDKSTISTASKPTTDLLGLPKDIRALVLRFCGLLRQYVVRARTTQPSPWCIHCWQVLSVCACRPILISVPLFRSCQQLHDEALEIFYTENTFRLLRLGGLPSAAWNHLRDLEFICLQSTRDYAGDSIVLNEIDFADTKKLWVQLCQSFAGLRTSPTTIMIELHGYYSVQQAQQLMLSLTQLPALAEIRASIKMTSGLSSALSYLEQQKQALTILSSSMRLLVSRPYRADVPEPGPEFQSFLKFTDLPRELRFMILSHTGVAQHGLVKAIDFQSREFMITSSSRTGTAVETATPQPFTLIWAGAFARICLPGGYEVHAFFISRRVAHALHHDLRHFSRQITRLGKSA